MNVLALILGFVTMLSALYAALTSRDEAAITATSISLTTLALIMLEARVYVAAIMQLSLVAGFTAAMIFLAPRLGGREAGTMPFVGAFVAVVVMLAFSIVSSKTPCMKTSPISELGAVLVGLSFTIILAAFLVLRVLISRRDIV